MRLIHGDKYAINHNWARADTRASPHNRQAIAAGTFPIRRPDVALSTGCERNRRGLPVIAKLSRSRARVIRSPIIVKVDGEPHSSITMMVAARRRVDDQVLNWCSCGLLWTISLQETAKKPHFKDRLDVLVERAIQQHHQVGSCGGVGSVVNEI